MIGAFFAHFAEISRARGASSSVRDAHPRHRRLRLRRLAAAPAPALQGHTVRALARDPARVSTALAQSASSRRARARRRASSPAKSSCSAATRSPERACTALAEVDVAYYLIHSMERTRRQTRSRSPSASGSRRATSPTPRARAGVRGSSTSAASPARAARPRLISPAETTVERILLDAVPDSVALRASIVIGARSRSFRFLVRLVERLPVLTLPAWRSLSHPADRRARHRRDAAAAATVTAVAGRSLDVGGPDVLSYGEMIARIAELMLLAPSQCRSRRERSHPSPPAWRRRSPGGSRAGAPADGEPARAICCPAARFRMPPSCSACDLHSFDSAVEHALREWEEIRAAGRTVSARTLHQQPAPATVPSTDEPRHRLDRHRRRRPRTCGSW